jgi:D-amino peptidase
MKILIACDMEGITGVVDWSQVDSNSASYPRFQHLMTQDVNAAIRGAAMAGADDILVSDGHGPKTNILIEEIDKRARLNSGTPSPLGMVQGIEDGTDAVLFIGYHARVGTENAVLSHTWSLTTTNVWLNDRVTGEIGLNASVCGHYGAPVLMISGDHAACNEAKEWIPGIETAVIKKGTARYAAECIPPEISGHLIEEAAARAINRFTNGISTKLVKTETPVKISIEFVNDGMVDGIALMPGVRRLDGRRIEFDNTDIVSAYWSFRSAVSLSR